MSARVEPFHRPSDCTGTPEERAAVDDLFATLFGSRDDPHFDSAHDGMAIAARNPALAGALAKLGGVVFGQLGWCRRADLRELAAQAVNRHFASDYSFESRRGAALAAGLSEAQLAALGGALPEALFSDEQRLVVEYARAVVAGQVPEPLFARMVAAFGETGAVEATGVIGFFAFWAMFLNATRP